MNSGSSFLHCAPQAFYLSSVSLLSGSGGYAVTQFFGNSPSDKDLLTDFPLPQNDSRIPAPRSKYLAETPIHKILVLCLKHETYLMFRIVYLKISEADSDCKSQARYIRISRCLFPLAHSSQLLFSFPLKGYFLLFLG